MKRSLVLKLVLSLLLALPLVCAHAAEGDPPNIVAVGETRYINYGFTPTQYDVLTESLTPDIVTTYYHTMTGVSPGMGTIRATFTRAGLETLVREYQVKVYPAPESVTFSEESLKLGIEETGHLTYTLPEGTMGTVQFSSDNPKLTVHESAGGIDVRALEACTGNVTVTTHNGKTDVCAVEVVPGPTGITLDRETAKLFVGQTLTLVSQATGGYTLGGVYYSSNDRSVCTVAEDGLVTALKAGTVTITARTYNGYTKQCQITVYDEPDAIDLSGNRSRIGVGEEIAFTPKDSGGNPLQLDLSVSDPSVLALRYGKYIKGLKEGTCTVTASSGLLSATYEITVCPAPTSIVLAYSDVTIKDSETVSLAPVLPGGAAGEILYSTYQEVYCASVSNDGVVKGLKPGYAIITAYTYNGKSASCKVTVAPSEMTFTLAPENGVVGVRKTLQLTLTDLGGSPVSATYKSENVNVATVDANTGLVTGVWVGVANITATVADGRQYTAHIRTICIPETITVSPTEMTLRVGQTGYYYLDSDAGPYYDFTSQSSDENVVHISLAAGRSFEAVGEGAATVTVTSFNGKQAAIHVTVLPKENVIAPSQGGSLYIGVGQTINMDVRDIFGKPVRCTYSSANPKIAKVDGKGNITGVNVIPTWVTRITATALDGRTCHVDVSVYASPSYLRLDVDSLVVPVGWTHQLTPSVRMESATFSVTYSTNKASVATVTSDGLITATGAGTCVITARTYNNCTDRVAVTVGAAPSSVLVSPTSMVIALGESRKLNITLPRGEVGEYFFLCDDPSIVSTYDGVVMGLRLGSARVTVKTYNNKTADCNVTVLPLADSVTLQCPLNVIGIRQTVKLNAVLPAGTAGNVQYSTSNAKVATVNQDGVVTGAGVGTVAITAAVGGKTSSVTLQVCKAPSSVKLNTRSAKMGIGDTLHLTVTLSAGATGTYAFQSSNAAVAAVDQSGLVTATGAGKAVITVVTYNGRKATCTVNVYGLPSAVSIKSAITLRPGRSYTLTPVFPKRTFSQVTYGTSNASVAKVSGAGKVIAAGPGTAIITVTTSNGKTAVCVVNVR